MPAAPALPTAPPATPAEEARIAHLDGWRGLSILLVLIGHLTWFDRAAHLGVEMFFVLSGRLMADLLVERRQPIGMFVWRRIARVWPALWVYVALVSAGLSVSYLFGDQRNLLAGALATLTFTANYVAGETSIPYFDHGWSLAVEEHAYLLLALIAVAARRRRAATIGAAGGLGLLAMANGLIQTRLFGANLYHTYLHSDVRAASVLLPFALHLLARTARGQAVLAQLPYLAPVAGAAALWWATRDPGFLRFGPGTLALAVAVVAIDAAPAGLRRALAAAPLAWLASLSFSLYLWQQPFMMLHRAGGPSLLCLTGTLAIGAWSYYRIERPARRRLATWSPRPGFGRLTLAA